jgi:hypothetical protein
VADTIGYVVAITGWTVFVVLLIINW